MKRKQWVNNLAILMMILGTVSLFLGSYVIVETTKELINCNLMLQDYNSLEVKRDEDTERYIQYNERRNELYNSDNAIVRTYSTQKSPVKVLIFIATLVLDFAVYRMWKYIIETAVWRFRKKYKKELTFLYKLFRKGGKKFQESKGYAHN